LKAASNSCVAHIRILERQIAELDSHPAADPLEIVELKKRKLAIKEELQAIERA